MIMKPRTRRQKAIIRRRIFLSVCAIALVALIAFTVALVSLITKDLGENKKQNTPSTTSTVSETQEPKLVSTVNVLSIGDIMCHAPQLKGGYNQSTDSYDFSPFFKEISKYFKTADLSIGNLEVTFGGKENGGYRGYPSFNTPDELADNIKNAGISLLLTANNHSYDTGLSGLVRTASVLSEKGISYTGTRQTANESKYIIKDVKGIKIGVANFTYETTNAESESGRKYLNGNKLASEANDLINSFSYTNIENFYAQAESIINDMQKNGAEFISFYLHWGEEYQLKENTWQKSIAQKLCNLGVDIIIGSHPHVVQPIELLYSEDGQNTTVCAYSLGNAVSNQRRELISSCPTGHTEDGLIFTYTLEKYSDGTVTLLKVDAIPTWVNKYQGNNGSQYTIYPIESADFGSTNYQFTGANLTDTKESFERTKNIISEGLTSCQNHLGCEVRFKEE